MNQKKIYSARIWTEKFCLQNFICTLFLHQCDSNHYTYSTLPKANRPLLYKNSNTVHVHIKQKANISCILILQKASCRNFLKRTNRERVLVFNENYIGERKLNCCWVYRMSAPGICFLCASASLLGTEDSLFHRDMCGPEHRHIAHKTHRLIPLCNSASDRPLLGNCVLLGDNLKLIIKIYTWFRKNSEYDSMPQKMKRTKKPGVFGCW